MALTRGQLLDRIQQVIGADDDDFRTYLEGSLDQMLFAFYDMHDWEFKHKASSFNTVAGTEEYTLSTGTTDLRSSQDLEVVFDSTNGTILQKVDLKDIRKRWPKLDTSGKPTLYAPWGSKKIFLSDEPDGIYTIKFLYLAKPTLPTTDADNLETTCGIPDYVHYLLEKMLLADGMIPYNDARRTGLMNEIAAMWLPNAIRADMKHLESGARFKFWEEELSHTGMSYNDYLRSWWNE